MKTEKEIKELLTKAELDYKKECIHTFKLREENNLGNCWEYVIAQHQSIIALLKYILEINGK